MQKRSLIPLTIMILLAFASSCSESPLQELKDLPLADGDRAEAERLHQQAIASHRSGDYAASAATWTLAAKADPGWYLPFYNLACALSKQGKPEPALEALRLAVERPTPENFRSMIEGDSDLAAVRELPGYQELYLLAGPMPGYEGDMQGPTGTWSSENCDPSSDLGLAGGAYTLTFPGNGSFSVSVATGPTFRGTFEFAPPSDLHLWFRSREFFNPGTGEMEETELTSRGEMSYDFKGGALCVDYITGESELEAATGCYCKE